MAYSCDAFPRDYRERLERKTGERDQQDTRDGAMTDGLTQTNEVARESQRELEIARDRLIQLKRAREEIWSYLDIMVNDRLTDLQSYSLRSYRD